MITFRGVEQSAIIQSLQNLCDYIAEKNPGPLSMQAIADWRAPRGLIDNLTRATSADEIAQAIENANDYDFEQADGGPRFNHWATAFLDLLMPQLESHAFKVGKPGEVPDEVVRQRHIIQDIFAWDGFYRGAPLSSMSLADHELMNYARTVLGASEDDMFLRYRDGFFKGPFQSYSAIYGARADFNQAAQTLRDFAKDHGLADHAHPYGIQPTDTGVALYITPQLAKAILADASSITDRPAPSGLMQAGIFTPVAPKP